MYSLSLVGMLAAYENFISRMSGGTRDEDLLKRDVLPCKHLTFFFPYGLVNQRKIFADLLRKIAVSYYDK